MPSPFLELVFDLGSLDAGAVEAAAFGCGALAVTFVDAQDSPDCRHAVLEPAPGEMPLWPVTRVRCLFADAAPGAPHSSALARQLAASLLIEVDSIEAQAVAARIWEREWLKDFHPLRFGRRLWVSPHHERVGAPGAVVVWLDPGLAFGTGTHASTALCLSWLDAHPPLGARAIDYGCGSGVLGIAAARLGAAAVHAFDTDPQALIATHENACANEMHPWLQVHTSAATLPAGSDLLLANILAQPLCALMPAFAALVRPGGQVVLAGLMLREEAEVTAAYAACFDVARFAERDGWVCLAGRRR
ncbi:MAG TPA: 50S ribosomal protein L11 methyltransferase [Steroidobacteraceae bacterium]|nr:50S ribosomal protein L11 methyltransferase [Steroidobacteraceae bacterium]